MIGSLSILPRKCGLLRHPQLNLLLDAARFGLLVRLRAPVPGANVRREGVGCGRAVGLQGREKDALLECSTHGGTFKRTTRAALCRAKVVRVLRRGNSEWRAAAQSAQSWRTTGGGASRNKDRGTWRTGGPAPLLIRLLKWVKQMTELFLETKHK